MIQETKENDLIQQNSVQGFLQVPKGPITAKSCHFSFLGSTDKSPILQSVN